MRALAIAIVVTALLPLGAQAVAPIEYRGAPSAQTRHSAPPQAPRLAAFQPANAAAPARPAIDLRGALPPAPTFDPIPINEPLDDGRPALVETHPAEAPPVAEPAPVLAAPAPAPSLQPGYVVQIGVFSEPANVERARARLADIGPVLLERRDLGARPATRVRLGPWESRATAEQALRLAESRGFAGALVARAP